MQQLSAASHLFEEAGAPDCVIELAAGWFESRLAGDERGPAQARGLDADR